MNGPVIVDYWISSISCRERSSRIRCSGLIARVEIQDYRILFHSQIYEGEHAVSLKEVTLTLPRTQQSYYNEVRALD